MNVVGKRALKSRMCEISYPIMSSICLMPKKIFKKIKVEVKKKKGKKLMGYDVYREPSYHEHVD